MAQSFQEPTCLLSPVTFPRTVPAAIGATPELFCEFPARRGVPADEIRSSHERGSGLAPMCGRARPAILWSSMKRRTGTISLGPWPYSRGPRILIEHPDPDGALVPKNAGGGCSDGCAKPRAARRARRLHGRGRKRASAARRGSRAGGLAERQRLPKGVP
jgi:hypothetical protein